MKIVLAIVMLGAGGACWNYMRPDNREHHVEWATEHGLPEPSAWIDGAALVLLAAGGVTLLVEVLTRTGVIGKPR